MLTGLLVFIPYLGFATGFVLALLVAALQFAGLGPIVAVLIVFGIGQLLESFLLTPFLVGDRIGLHPLAVIFALMAFGQLFGFFGVLLALPASAALLVGLRELRSLYLASRFYQGHRRGRCVTQTAARPQAGAAADARQLRRRRQRRTGQPPATRWPMAAASMRSTSGGRMAAARATCWRRRSRGRPASGRPSAR